ncbi:hypothetical protein [Sphingomonas sp. UYEF23]|uniref:hypothetical protein n=1 Tax=Sphingomonas sp. UYEF23 TaxID=1756408 RepID=UPI00339694E5
MSRVLIQIAAPQISPFANWKATDPTKSLSSFAAYHGVKHNREHEFERATLANGFAAVAACAVLLVAQFGQDCLTRELADFLLVEAPTCPVEAMYLMPVADGTWSPTPLPGLD